MQTEHSPFPPDETLAAYIDGRLDEETRRRVVEHMAECPECLDVLRANTEMTALISADSKPTIRPIRIAAFSTMAAAAAVAAILLVPPIRDWFSRQRVDNKTLAALTPRYRTGTARLSGLPYRPTTPVTRGGPRKEISDPALLKLYARAGELEESVQRDPSAENMHALGVAHLMLGNVDTSVQNLEKALMKSTGEYDLATAIARATDVRLLTDLAAALLARPGDADQELLALDIAGRAWRLSRTPETAWNRAVAITAVSKGKESADAWRDYLALDGTSEWAREARRRLEDVVAPSTGELWERQRQTWLGDFSRSRTHNFVGNYRVPARQYAEELLGVWASTRTRDSARASEVLRIVAAIGQALRDGSGGDSMLADAEAVIRNTCSTLDSVRCGSLVRGHRAFSAGMSDYANGSVESAERQFRIAAQELAVVGSSFAHQASFYISVCAFMRNDFKESHAQLDALRRRLGDETTYRDLLSRINWVAGLCDDHMGEPQRALANFAVALERYESLSEPEYQASLHQVIGDLLERMGDLSGAMEHHRTAVMLLFQTGTTIRRHQILFEAANTAMQAGHMAAADLWLSHLASAELRNGPSADACITFTWLAVVRMRGGDVASARKSISEAEKRCAAITDRDIRERANATVAVAMSTLSIDGRDITVDEISRSIAFFRRIGSRIWIAPLLQARGRLYLRARNPERAEADFMSAVEEIDHQGVGVAQSIVPPLPDSASVYDDAIALMIAGKRYSDAVTLSDRASEAATTTVYGELEKLPNVFRGKTRRSPVSEVQRALPPATIVCDVVITPEIMLLAVFNSSRITYYERPVTRARFRGLAHEAIKTISDSDNVRDVFAAEELSRILFTPWLRDVPEDSTIVLLVPPSVEPIPFAALTIPGTKLRIVERYAAVAAPALRNLAASPQQESRSRIHALFVAPSAAPDEEPLGNSAAEVSRAAAVYDDSRVLVGPIATRSTFLRAVADAEVIHFAGHSVMNDAQPLMSALAFSPSAEGGERLLRTYELCGSALGRARLVVLAACDTARTSRPAMSIARGLALQVPAVVASLWPLDDRAAAALFPIFHKQIREGKSVAAALRIAQLALIHSNDPELCRPTAWAAVELVGTPS